jgi:hypothetical protein
VKSSNQFITLVLTWPRALRHIPRSSSSSSDLDSETSYNFSETSRLDSGSGSTAAASSLASSGGLIPLKREWSSRQIVGRAVGNISTCLAWPMVFRQHTVRDMFLCSQRKVSKLRCDETFAFSTFWEDEITNFETQNSS